MKKIVLLVIVFLYTCVLAQAQGIARVKITDIEKKIAESTQPLIINFWATFCKPCLEEMPHFQKMANEYANSNLQLLFVSLDLEEDFPKSIQRMVKSMKISSPVVWLDEFDADYFCPKVDSSWSGSLPASLFINNKKGYRQFREQVLNEDQLRKEIEAMLQPW